MSNSAVGQDWATYKRLLGYVRPYWVIFVLAVIGFFLGSGAEAYFMTLFGDLVDSWDSNLVQAAWTIPALMLLAAVLRAVGEITGEMLLSQVSFSVVHNIRTELFEQLLQMPSAYFDASSQGHLVSRLTYNVAQLRDTGTDALKSIVQDGGKVLVYFGAMLYFNWRLTLIFVAVAPLVAVVAAYASRRFRRISRRIQRSMGDVTHVTSEAVASYQVVRIFGGEGYERDRFFRASINNKRQNIKMVATKVLSTQVIQVFVALALAAMIVVLYQPAVGGAMSSGDVVAFLGFAGLLVRPIRRLAELNARLQRGLAAAEDIFGQLDESQEPDAGRYMVDRAMGRLEFRDVGFRYQRPDQQQLLRDLSFTIEPGQTVALVGRSGSGKTTVASLIPRFYEPTSGEILLDGVPLHEYDLRSLRRQIALVSQHVTLFNDSLERNVAYGVLGESSPEQIHDAVARAHADGFISELPDGLQTVVGDNGVLLSGGQRQRVAIARALLKDAPILILDEATSSLDAESERQIQSALEEVIRGRTTLVIAHRLSTIEKADRILVLDKGQVIETGRHEELLASGGAYADLYRAQFEDEPGAQRTGLGPMVLPTNTPNVQDAPVESDPPVHPWYSGARWPLLLTPLSWLYGWVARRRRRQFLRGRPLPWRAPVPVIVVGNITAGGTGKTPLTIWLANWLGRRGVRAGIVSRGYRGKARRVAMEVEPHSDPRVVGDEAPVLASRTECPVFVCADRPKAVEALLAKHQVDVVISDDGLQHYGLARDVEIAVVDGERGLGNGHYLPAGPLRESAARLEAVDWVVSREVASGLVPDEAVMCTRALAFVGAEDGRRMTVPDFVKRFPSVNAVAGIGNPLRFASVLRRLGLIVALEAFPDHYQFDGSDLVNDGGSTMVCTEKDYIKIRRLKNIPHNLWYLEIDVELDVGAERRLSTLLASHGLRVER